MKPIKTLKSNTVYKSPYVSIKDDLVKHQNGFESHYHVVDTNDFAAVIPIGKNNETYMVRQYRYPSKIFSLEFPMGAIDKGEKEIDAARRELHEETGIKAKTFEYLGKVNPAQGKLSNSAYLYLATNLVTFGEPICDETECLELVKIDLEEVDVLIKKGEIVDGPTIFLKHLYDLSKKV